MLRKGKVVWRGGVWVGFVVKRVGERAEGRSEKREKRKRETEKKADCV